MKRQEQIFQIKETSPFPNTRRKEAGNVAETVEKSYFSDYQLRWRCISATQIHILFRNNTFWMAIGKSLIFFLGQLWGYNGIAFFQPSGTPWGRFRIQILYEQNKKKEESSHPLSMKLFCGIIESCLIVNQDIVHLDECYQQLSWVSDMNFSLFYLGTDQEIF